MNSSSLFLGFCVRLIITRKWGNHDVRGNTGENTSTLYTVETWGCSTDGLESTKAPLLTPYANHSPNQSEPHQNKPLETEDGTQRPTAGPRVSQGKTRWGLKHRRGPTSLGVKSSFGGKAEGETGGAHMRNGGDGSAASGRPSGLEAEHRGRLAGDSAERRRWVCVCDAGQGGFQQWGRRAME